MVVEKNKPSFSLYDSICTFCISTWNLDQCTEGHASSEMRTTKLTSTLTTVAYVHSNVNRNWVSPKHYHRAMKIHLCPLLRMNFGQIGHQTVLSKNALANLSWKVVCPCPGSMEHDSKTWCSHHHGEGETALEPIRAGHSGDHAHRDELLCNFHPRVSAWVVSTTVWGVVASLSYNYMICLQSVSAKPNADMFGNLSFSTLLWAACLTKLHKAYFSNRFFAPVRTRSLGGTSSNMARSVSISAMLRHLLGTRGTNVEYLKLVTMMMVNDKILAALWWNHHLDCLRKKTSFSVENWVSRFPGPRFSCFARCFASSTRTKLKRSRSGRSLPSSVPSCFMMAVPSTTWTWTSA